MGLLAEFTMDDLGYADSTDELGIYIDYSYGCEVFKEVFLAYAKDMVPVDTGRLRASINAYASSDGCRCVATADYAQYVEYGTVKMSAQPYFEPALNAALAEASFYWDEAVEEAYDEELELLEEIAEREAEMNAREGSSREGGIGGLFANVFAMVLAGIILGFVNAFLDLITYKESDIGGTDRISGGSDISSLFGWARGIEVEIT